MTARPRSKRSLVGAVPLLGEALHYAALGYSRRPQEVASPFGVSLSQAHFVMRREVPNILLPGSGGGERARRRCRRKDLLAWIGERVETEAGRSRQDQR